MKQYKTKTLLVLSGGFGTRLRSVVQGIPKALAPVGNVPFLDILIESWLKNGFNKLVFLLHYEADQIISFLNEKKSQFPGTIKIEFVVEQKPLGTGGAVVNAIRECKIREDFFVINADTWLGDGPATMLSANSPSIGVIEVEDTSRYGAVTIDENNFITGFSEKSNSGGGGWINAGLYKVHPDHFAQVADSVFSMEKVILPNLSEAGILKAVRLDDDFIDIGVPEDYYRFVQKNQQTKI